MIESIIAITIGVVALTGVLNLLTNSLGINRDVGQRFTATYLAMEGIEITKGIINSNYSNGDPWNDGLSRGSYEFQYNTLNPSDNKINSNSDFRSNSALYFNDSLGLYSYNTTNNQTRFTRTIQIEPLRDSEEMKVRSVVEWEEGSNEREIVIEDHFFNWRPVTN